MAKCSERVGLPPKVDNLIEEICEKHKQPPLDPTLRLELARIGEQHSLHILNQILTTGIKKSFTSFLLYMLQNSPSSSPSKPYKEQVPLPNSVENLIKQICKEQKKPPLDSIVRKELAEIGEEEALHILNYIKEKEIEKSFGGFVRWKVKMKKSSSSPSTQQFASSSSASVTLDLSTFQGRTRSQIVVKEDEEKIILSMEALVIQKSNPNKN